MPTFYITTPIYYVNDVPHIGHAYTTIAADVLARYFATNLPYNVFFLTGVDEHGQKVQQAAAKAGIDPKAYCDSMVPRFQNLWSRLNISNDAFIRTTDAPHQQIVQSKLQDLFDKKLIYRADYTGWYCTFDERFWTEKDVINGLCPDCQRPVERLSESNYFFRMSQYQKELLAHMKAHPGLANTPTAFIRPPSRFNEVFSFLEKQQLEDLSISRPISRLSWGIPLPFDPNYITYVWFDALVNYISALEYLNPNPAKRYWPTPDDKGHKVLHLVGKDILTTHAVYWSTMLMALGIELPTTIFAHGWWTVNGEKMSKSRGNVVDPNIIIDEFNGPDPFRYFLLREVPFGQDGDFSREAMIQRYNSELADGLGNLLSRTLTMIERSTQGRIPAPVATARTALEVSLDQMTGQLTAEAMDHIEQLRFSRALESMWELVQHCDQYIDKTAPWALAKRQEDKARLHTVLYSVAKALEFLIPFLYPFMPQKAVEMARQLGLNPRLEGRKLDKDKLAPGTEIYKGAPLFPRIVDTGGKLSLEGKLEATPIKGGTRVTQENETQPTISAPAATAQPVVPPPVTAQITIEEFQKVHLKVAKVLSAERVPKSEKLLKLQVDLGGEQRQIVAGIGKKYEPESLVGRRVVIVANLKPAKLMGVESQGMVLAAGDKEVGGLVTILEDVEPGTKVK